MPRNFSIGGSRPPSQVPPDRIPMSDITELVLTGSFATALGIFVISAVVRSIAEGKSRPIRLAEPPESGNSFPDPPPHKVPPDLPAGKVPVWFYQPIDLVGAAVVFMVFSGLFLMSAGTPQDRVARLDPATLLVNIGFQFVIAGIVTILATRRVAVVSWLGLRWPSWHWVILIAPGAVVFMWMVFGGLQWSGYVKWMESLGVETVQDTVKLLQKSDDPRILGLMAFAAVVAAPICEEIVFRGFFYPVMKKFAGVWPAALCSALVFAAAHGNLAALLPLFIFGGVLVFIYEKTGSIWAPMAVHCCFNGATVVLQMAARYYHLPIDPAP